MALRDLWTPSQDLKRKKVKKLNNDKFYRSRLDLVSYNFLLYLQLLKKLLNATNWDINFGYCHIKPLKKGSYSPPPYYSLLSPFLNVANANIQRPLLVKYVFNFKKNVSS